MSRPLRISLYRHLLNTEPTALEIPFESLPQILRLHTTLDKGIIPLWSPAEIRYGGKRQNSDVVAVHCGVVDLDDVPEADLRRVVLPAIAEIQHVVHSTHSHWAARASGRVRARVVLALSRPVLPAEWLEVWRRYTALVGIAIGRAGADPAAKDPSRAYWLPSAPPDAAGAAFLSAGGTLPLDVDRLLERDWRRLSAPRATLATLGKLADQLGARRAATSQDLSDRVRRLAAGQRIAEPGERDDAVFRLVCLLSRELRGASEAEIVATFADSIHAMRSDPDPLTLEGVAAKVARIRAQNPDPEAHDSEGRKRWAECLARAGREAPYTDEELEQIARDVGLKGPDDLVQSWVLQRGQAYWLLGQRDGAAGGARGWYHGPYQASELPERAEIALAAADSAGVICQTGSGAGAARRLGRKKPADLVADHGQVLDGVVRDLRLQGPRLDQATRTLHVACAPLRDLEPVRSESVERWLQLLGGDEHEHMLDWIASVTRLEQPCAALYLDGKKGAGKTLLAQGLARLWVEGAPTELEDALADFNDRLAYCPLILGDERVPKDRIGQPRTEDLRALISSYRRSLKIKYQPTTELLGSVRIIVAANNLNLFSTIGDLTVEDVEAICARLLHVHVGPAAAQYLIDAGGHEMIRRWVDGDEIAKHALWLRENRVVVPGRRFLVEGRSDALVRSLVTSTGLRAAVCHWLVQWLLEPSKLGAGLAAGPGPLVAVRSGRIEASARGLQAHWAVYETHYRGGVPVISRISAALRGIGSGTSDVKVGASTVRHVVVNVENLVQWAEEHGYCSAEDIHDAIRRAGEARPAVGMAR